MIGAEDDTMIVAEVVINDHAVQAENTILPPEPQHSLPAAANESTQCNFVPHFLLTIEGMERNAEAIKYYTDFDDYAHFMLMFSILGPNTQCIGLNDCGLTAVNQFLLTMIILRQGKDDYELSFLIGVSKAVVSTFFTTLVHFMYSQLKQLDIWPSRETVSANMPTHFKELVSFWMPQKFQFKNQKIQMCKVLPSLRTRTKNALKVMVGCTPKGTVSFISDAYGGCTSRPRKN